jgi:hypothetical protein
VAGGGATERTGGLAQAATLAALAAVYFAAGKLGLFLAVVHPIASPVWPASGIAIAAVLLLGQRVCPPSSPPRSS